MSRVHITIDGLSVFVDDKQPLLVHTRNAGIEIPTLCHDDRLSSYPTCGLCIVTIEGRKGFASACARLPENGMAIHTNSEEIIRARRQALKLLFSDHYANCIPPCRIKKPPNKFISRRSDFSLGQCVYPICIKEVAGQSGGQPDTQLFEPPSLDCKICQCTKMASCEIRRLAIEYQVLPDEHRGQYHAYEFRRLNPLLGLDMNKCIRCAKCIRACGEIQGVGVLGFINRGFDTDLCYTADMDGKESQCMECTLSGARCVEMCPTGAFEILKGDAAAEKSGVGA